MGSYAAVRSAGSPTTSSQDWLVASGIGPRLVDYLGELSDVLDATDTDDWPVWKDEPNEALRWRVRVLCGRDREGTEELNGFLAQVAADQGLGPDARAAAQCWVAQLSGQLGA